MKRCFLNDESSSLDPAFVVTVTACRNIAFFRIYLSPLGPLGFVWILELPLGFLRVALRVPWDSLGLPLGPKGFLRAPS